MPVNDVVDRFRLTCISVEGAEKSDNKAKFVVPLRFTWWVEWKEIEVGGWGAMNKPLVELGNTRCLQGVGHKTTRSDKNLL
jgi:hypothetical protein